MNNQPSYYQRSLKIHVPHRLSAIIREYGICTKFDQRITNSECLKSIEEAVSKEREKQMKKQTNNKTQGGRIETSIDAAFFPLDIATKVKLG